MAAVVLLALATIALAKQHSSRGTSDDYPKGAASVVVYKFAAQSQLSPYDSATEAASTTCAEPYSHATPYEQTPYKDEKESPYCHKTSDYAHTTSCDENNPSSYYEEHQSPYYEKQSPYYEEHHSPYYEKKSPYYEEHHSPYYEKQSPYCEEHHSPYYEKESPYYGKESPYYEKESSYYEKQSPYYEKQSPYYEDHHSPYYEKQSPYYENHHSQCHDGDHGSYYEKTTTYEEPTTYYQEEQSPYHHENRHKHSDCHSEHDGYDGGYSHKEDSDYVKTADNDYAAESTHTKYITETEDPYAAYEEPTAANIGEHSKLPVGPDPNNPLAPYLLDDSQKSSSPLSTKKSSTALASIVSDLKDANIVPDILSSGFVPEFNITIAFNGKFIEMGQLLSISDVQAEPTIEFDAPNGQYFTIAIVDPDAPSVSRHGYRSYRHYLISNLSDNSATDVLTPYQPPSPSFASGAHRYAVVVFRQHGRVELSDEDIPESRVRFNAVDWAHERNMKPVAASYFLVKRKRIHEKMH
ncbi:Phosphatidylethanolamine-binding protein 1 [Coemansia guatemalensis]|uniref:Phosphatidylethanolamine-binding protein 1 n=1 Tax=Coemansia guatemalensis TaxID=2761395 RepID=A0A9W8I3E6_9FUNG|nr:Phosphatidylethanolamine-binding protein 1 [Coemansia guatemalensis]